jgi:hypothetical protein
MLAGITGFSLVGCTVQQEAKPLPEVEAPEAVESEAPPAAFVVDGSAEDNLPFFRETLAQFAGGAEPVQGEWLVNTLANAGFDKAAMQVSFDQSQTGLVADSLFVSVRIDASCLIGQVVTSDRSVTIELMPTVGPNEDLCLIGHTRPIDW